MDDKQSGGGNTKESLAWVFNILALAVAFGSWGYTVVAPEPDLYLGSFLFLVAVLLSIAAGWVTLPADLDGR